MAVVGRLMREPYARGSGSTQVGGPGVDGVGVEVVAGDGVLDDRGLQRAVGGQRGQHRGDDVAGVDLEVAAQGLAGVAAAEAVGAERDEAAPGRAPTGRSGRAPPS